MKNLAKILLLVSSLLSSFSASAITKPTVYLLATGGTIAGSASSSTATTYKAGSLSASDILASVPGINKLAYIKYQQVFNKDSGNLTLQDWLVLAKKVNQTLKNPAVTGVVITHGTDTLEETAYFLNLVLSNDKPVVLVGSMRPATAISPDGPANLYDAVAVATNPKTHGVVVVMNDKIFDARDVTKTNTTNVAAFQSPNSGPIGQVVMGKVNYYMSSTNLNNHIVLVDNLKQLPKVEIIYTYVGVSQVMLDNILKTPGLKGLVIAGVGDGNIPDYENKFLMQARKQGIIIVRSSSTGSGKVSYDYNNLDTTYGLIAGNNLNPKKARILLMLSLLHTSNSEQIQQIFNTH